MTEFTNNIGYVYLLDSRLSSILVNIINLTFEKYPLNLLGFQSFYAYQVVWMSPKILLDIDPFDRRNGNL